MGTGVSNNKCLSLCEIQFELLAILKKSASYFEKKNIEFSLSDGTLLGAVRHKGFIPWDDDVDIVMSRPNYERFISVLDDFESMTGLAVETCRQSNFYYPFAKIKNPSIVAQEDAREGFCQGRLWIDVFPLDGVPESFNKYRKLVLHIHRCYKLIGLICTSKSPSKAKQLAKKVLGPIVRLLVDPCKIAMSIERHVMRTDYNAAEKVACLVYGNGVVDKAFLREGFSKMVKMDFEGIEFPCMSCYDEYLTNCYGDYMSLPPIKDRRTHGMKAWRIHDLK